MTVTVIAHRGASRAAPENTIEAFRLAGALGAAMVELDARLLADGALAVHHDAVLADGRAVAELTAGELPPEVPLLGAAVEACGPLAVNVEIKNLPGEPGYDPEHRVVAVLAAFLAGRPRDRFLCSSFNPETLAALRAIDGSVRTALLLIDPGHDVDRVARRAGRAGHEALHPWDATTTEALVRAAHGHGLAVNVWTVDDPERMRELAGWGVDGICTNVPDVAVAALA